MLLKMIRLCLTEVMLMAYQKQKAHNQTQFFQLL